VSDIARAVVLAGGLAYEREVSLASGRRVVDALRSVDVEAQLADTDADLLPRLAADPPDAVFIALHGGAGEDGSIRSVLELLGVPFVGAGAAASRLAYDKPSAKAAVRAAGIPAPHGVVLGQASFRELGVGALLDRLVDGLGLPLVVKPASGGSSMGLSVVEEGARLPGALAQTFSYSATALVEEFVGGAEVAVPVLDRGDGPRALPAVEVVPRRGVYDYAAHYTAGETEFHVPARLPADAARRVADVAVTAHRVLGLRDFSRTDAIVTPSGDVVFLEVSVSPGLTETSTLALAAAHEGLDLGALFRDLLAAAVARQPASATS
jgi:D-alanine-D-alanine ligase